MVATMKVALISDTHGMLPEIPADVDAVIHAGDVGPDREPLKWFAGEFSDWAKIVGVPIYMTWGNHDRIGETYRDKQFWKDLLPKNVHVCVDELVHISQTPGDRWSGKHVWFSPWSPLFGNWAWMRTEEGLQEKWNAINPMATVLVSHTPPYGHCDYLESGESVGSKTLYDTFKGHNSDLSLIVCGHIHNGRGTSNFGEERRWQTVVRNVACVDEQYRPIKDPVVVLDWGTLWPVNEKRAEPLVEPAPLCSDLS